MSTSNQLTLTMENGLAASMAFPAEPTLTLATDNAAAFVAAVGTVVGAISSYEQLNDLPSIEGVTLRGNHTTEQLGVTSIGNAAILALF